MIELELDAEGPGDPRPFSFQENVMQWIDYAGWIYIAYALLLARVICTEWE